MYKSIFVMKANDKLSVPIFLIDDDKMYLSSLTHKLLERFKSDIEVFSFTNGEDFLRTGHKEGIVILDYYLDSEHRDAMNGLEVLQKIKDEPDSKNDTV